MVQVCLCLGTGRVESPGLIAECARPRVDSSSPRTRGPPETWPQCPVPFIPAFRRSSAKVITVHFPSLALRMDSSKRRRFEANATGEPFPTDSTVLRREGAQGLHGRAASQRWVRARTELHPRAAPNPPWPASMSLCSWRDVTALPVALQVQRPCRGTVYGLKLACSLFPAASM